MCAKNVCMCVCMHVFVYVNAKMQSNICVYVCAKNVCMRVVMYVCVFVYVNAKMQSNIYVLAHVHVYLYAHLCCQRQTS